MNTAPGRAAHWDRIWHDRDPESVTWYQADLALSRQLIERARPDLGAPIIDVGGGASRLVDHLLAAGHTDVTVLDIAPTSLAAAQRRLGPAADRVDWIVGDITKVALERTYAIWHDRAVFHFLVDGADRDAYLRTLRSALAAGGHLVIATFGPEGPETCSGLPVRRYDIALMQRTLGDDLDLVEHELETHVAPSGVTQQFLAARFRRADSSAWKNLDTRYPDN